MKLALFCLAALLFLTPVSARSMTVGDIFTQTNWNSLVSGIYDNYIFYKTRLDSPNIGYFLQAMRECGQKLEDCLEGKGPEWQDEAITRFRNMIALAQVGLYEMNRFAATENFTDQSLEVIAILQACFKDMREKGFFATSETDFMRRFRQLEESGAVGDTCKDIIVSRSFEAPGSTLLQEYLKYNSNVQHVILSAASGDQSCLWAGNCIREEGGKIKCRGTLGSLGGFTGAIANGRLVILTQTLDSQCGFSAMAGVYEERQAASGQKADQNR